MLQQRQQALRKQQGRRTSGTGVMKSNRAFMGGSRNISTGMPGSMRNFSAPKAIDPLAGEEDTLPSSPIKATGYAEGFHGGYKSRQEQATFEFQASAAPASRSSVALRRPSAPRR